MYFSVSLLVITSLRIPPFLASARVFQPSKPMVLLQLVSRSILFLLKRSCIFHYLYYFVFVDQIQLALPIHLVSSCLLFCTIFFFSFFIFVCFVFELLYLYVTSSSFCSSCSPLPFLFVFFSFSLFCLLQFISFCSTFLHPSLSPSFLPSILPSFHPSFLPSFPPSFLPSSFLSSFLPSFLS